MKIAARIMISLGIILMSMSLLVHADDKNMELLQAAEKGETDKVKALIREGADANAKDKRGHTALYLVTQECHTECLKALLEAKSGVNVENINIIIALRVARLVGCTEAVELLKAAAGNGSMVDKANRTPAVATPRTMKDPNEDKAEIVTGAGCELPSTQEIPSTGTFAINLASFRQKQRADRYVEELKRLGLFAYCWEVNLPEKGRWYRVSVGGFSTLKEARNYTKELGRKGISDTFITKIPDSL
jgi:ankyrin repeat protein